METTPSFPTSSFDLLRSPLFNQYWYYAIELLPGAITPGCRRQNFGLTRTLFNRADVRGRSVLDIGTMEGAIPILAGRQGAKKNIGVDFARFHEKVEAVKHYTGVDFEYYFGLTHAETSNFLKQRNHHNFDIIVLSGVLYHCFSPLHTLAMARSLVRTGGLMIVETWAIADQDHGMFFNTHGRFAPNDPSTLALIS
jgi:2-polyprenyl-3-methyl-5-hydroxy-6-metoxy-1,4-benzoquinol methylase